MRQWPLFSRVSHLLRALLWIATLLIMALATLGKPVSWAAPVTAPRNQTVPPVVSSIYLPAVQRGPCVGEEENLIKTLEANSGFSTLLQVFEAANLTTALENAGPFTIFAPTDAAFAALPNGALEQLLANPTGQLTQILLYHIVPGELAFDDLQNGMTLTTQQGKSINIARNADCEVQVNGARLVKPNIKASNGMIHAIDALLLPPPD